jgi:bacillithiol biosynthesis cysteine-adding enzyme BshC
VINTHTISFRSIPKTPPLFLDYLERGRAASQLYPRHFLDPHALRDVAQTLKFDPPLRKNVAAALAAQNQRWNRSAATSANLEVLSQPESFAVVTGQQVGLLTGPCYSIYKALTAVKLAQELTHQGLRCVPIFWMETGDHDLEEINHVSLMDSGSQKLASLKLEVRESDNQRPVGQIVLGSEMEGFLKEFRLLLPPGSEFSDQTIRLVEECYKAGSTLGDAFARMMSRLLGDLGLILMDPSDPALAALSLPVFDWALESAEKLRARLNAANESVRKQGFEPQIKIDPQTAFVFSTGDGRRRLLLKEGDHVWPKGSDHRITLSEAKRLAKENPEKLSPSVALRPLVQDFLLPTVAYVGGPTETSYFAELTGFYELVDRPMPVLVPRASVSVITKKAHRLLEKYALDVQTVFEGREKLAETIVERSAAGEGFSRFEHLEAEINRLLNKMKPEMEKADPTLGGALETARQKILYQVTHLKTRFVHTEEKRQAQVIQHAEALANVLWPNRALQERELNVCYFLSRYGHDFIKILFDAIEPLAIHHKLLALDS